MQSKVKKQLHEMQILIIHDKTEVDPKKRIKCFVGCGFCHMITCVMLQTCKIMHKMVTGKLFAHEIIIILKMKMKYF